MNKLSSHKYQGSKEYNNKYSYMNNKYTYTYIFINQ